MSSPAASAAAPSRYSLAALHRLAVVALLGFASGLPLALTGQAMQAWLSADGIDIATIGFLSLVGLPYTFKFLWAPLMDRFEPPWLGRRRGWLVITQLALAGALLWMASTPPASALGAFALLARPVSVARNDLLGFLAVAVAVALGFVVTRYAFSPLARELVLPLFAGGSVAANLQQRWADLAALFAGIAFTLPLVTWAARRARF